MHNVVPTELKASIRPRLEGCMLLILKFEPSNFTSKPPSSTNNFTIMEMKSKYLEMMTNDSSCLEDELDLVVYNALLNAVARDEAISKASKEMCKKDTL
ncbi:hypothetical protein Tco_0609352 [Tanacetum coccineum]